MGEKFSDFAKKTGKFYPRRPDKDLPQIYIFDQLFFVDWLHRELRPADGKTGPLSMAKMELITDAPEGVYHLNFLYDRQTRTIAPQPKILYDFPKNLFLMELPADPRILDPLGVAIEKGKNPVEYLKKHPVPFGIAARVIPWQSTKYGKAIDENRSYRLRTIKNSNMTTEGKPKRKPPVMNNPGQRLQKGKRKGKGL